MLCLSVETPDAREQYYCRNHVHSKFSIITYVLHGIVVFKKYIEQVRMYIH